MTPAEFVRTHRARWERLDGLVTRLGTSRRGTGEETVELAELYRSACADAARAQGLGADPQTIAYLDVLVARSHNVLYGAPRVTRADIGRLVAKDFPRLVRRNLAPFLLSTLAFYGPFAFGIVACLLLPDFAAAVMGRDQMELYRRMYDAAPDAGRSATEGGLGVSFYIQHNTSIGFRVFATGIFGGVGGVFMLLYQGLVIGTTFGFLIADEKARHLLTFCCGHAAWELTAIVLSGAAGLRMGWALVQTEGRSRLASLRRVGPEVVRIMGGAAVFFAIAAAIEGLWSPSTVPAEAKWVFAAVQVLFVAAYLSLAGRERRSP